MHPDPNPIIMEIVPLNDDLGATGGVRHIESDSGVGRADDVVERDRCGYSRKNDWLR